MFAIYLCSFDKNRQQFTQCLCAKITTTYKLVQYCNQWMCSVVMTPAAPSHLLPLLFSSHLQQIINKLSCCVTTNNKVGLFCFILLFLSFLYCNQFEAIVWATFRSQWHLLSIPFSLRFWSFWQQIFDSSAIPKKNNDHFQWHVETSIRWKCLLLTCIDGRFVLLH